MIAKAVIDASVVLKWFSGKNEELVTEAREVHRKIIEGELQAWAPVLMLTEVLNILARKKKLEGKLTRKVMARLVNMGISWVTVGAKEVDGLAQVINKYQVTAYDGQYLWLAEKEKCCLLTTDKELLKVKKISVKLGES